MFRDEIARIQPTVGLFAVARANKWRNEFAHFKMEMRKISSPTGTDGCDLLPAPDVILRINKYLVAMAVIRLHVPARAILLDCMQDNDDVAPARSAIARQQNAAISHGVNRIAEIGIFSTDTIEVVTEVMIFGETLRVIGQRAVLAAEWKIETRRDWE